MAEGTLGIEEDQLEHALRELISQQELVRLIKGVPNPEMDSMEFMLEPDPKAEAMKYLNNLRRQGSMVIAVENSDRRGEWCNDCRGLVTHGVITLIRAENPDDIEFGDNLMGVLVPTVKQQPAGLITETHIPLIALHQIETHGKDDQRVNTQEVLAVIRGNQQPASQGSQGQPMS